MNAKDILWQKLFMNKNDILWQKLLDEEKLRLTNRPTGELLSMTSCTAKAIQSGKTTIEYVIWHVDHEFAFRQPERINHSFILQTSRTVFPGLQRKYLSGFSLDCEGEIIAISDEILYAYD